MDIYIHVHMFINQGPIKRQKRGDQVEPSARSRSRPVSWRSLLMAARNASRCGRIASKLLTVVWRRRATSGASAADPDATVYVCIHTFMILYIHTYMYVHVYIYMCTYIHIYVYAHTHIYICVYTHTYEYKYK